MRGSDYTRSRRGREGGRGYVVDGCGVSSGRCQNQGFDVDADADADADAEAEADDVVVRSGRNPDLGSDSVSNSVSGDSGYVLAEILESEKSRRER
ncbi:hypothetical protein F53441_10408 [Fusarium austroafricanum]|uniref:Uncharacterized protein n=1 Tax=Fusarium austroafricanum TaxID=2364996 RepID=A0A8H4K6Z5_9HYPO|nr:hypothetical protein F53441_10408 [Fusarium austroafricanum]